MSGTAADTIETVVPKHLDRLPRSRWVAALERAGAGYVAKQTLLLGEIGAMELARSKQE